MISFENVHLVLASACRTFEHQNRISQGWLNKPSQNLEDHKHVNRPNTDSSVLPSKTLKLFLPFSSERLPKVCKTAIKQSFPT
jgi:hypothetical protein